MNIIHTDLRKWFSFKKRKKLCHMVHLGWTLSTFVEWTDQSQKDIYYMIFISTVGHLVITKSQVEDMEIPILPQVRHINENRRQKSSMQFRSRVLKSEQFHSSLPPEAGTVLGYPATNARKESWFLISSHMNIPVCRLCLGGWPKLQSRHSSPLVNSFGAGTSHFHGKIGYIYFLI